MSGTQGFLLNRQMEALMYHASSKEEYLSIYASIHFFFGWNKMHCSPIRLGYSPLELFLNGSQYNEVWSSFLPATVLGRFKHSTVCGKPVQVLLCDDLFCHALILERLVQAYTCLWSLLVLLVSSEILQRWHPVLSLQKPILFFPPEWWQQLLVPQYTMYQRSKRSHLIAVTSSATWFYFGIAVSMDEILLQCNLMSIYLRQLQNSSSFFLK